MKILLCASRFQACLYFAAVFQAVACGIHYLASVFLVVTPKFLCGSPDNVTGVLFENHSAGALADIWRHFAPGSGPVVVRTAAGEQWELSQCRRALRINPTDFAYYFAGNKSMQSCAGRFSYDLSEIQQSIVTDWDLVCEKEWLAKFCQPTFMLGVLIGAVVFGDIADRSGWTAGPESLQSGECMVSTVKRRNCSLILPLYLSTSQQ